MLCVWKALYTNTKYYNFEQKESSYHHVTCKVLPMQSYRGRRAYKVSMWRRFKNQGSWLMTITNLLILETMTVIYITWLILFMNFK